MTLVRRFLLILLLSGCFVQARGETLLRVETQDEFDAVRDRLEMLLREGERQIVLRLGPGPFFFRDNHLRLTGIDRPDVSITIQGDSTLLVGAGYDCVMQPDGASFSAAMQAPYHIEDGLVSVRNETALDTRSAAAPCFAYPFPTFKRHEFTLWTRSHPIAEADADDASLYFSQWYDGAVYKIRRIRNGRIRFIVGDGGRKAETRLYSEFRYGRCRPRYMIDNEVSGMHPYVLHGRMYHSVPDTLHIARAATFLSFEGVRIDSFSISGIRFLGSSGQAPLLDCRQVESRQFSVRDCRFTGIRGDVISLQGTGNVRIEGNVMEYCYRCGVYADNDCSNTEVSNNYFRMMGLGYSNYAVIYCKARNYSISGNTLVDFCYIGIAVGAHFTEPVQSAPSGVVSRNELYQTEPFRRNGWMILTDSGAIYVYSQNGAAEVVGNYIHDIGGQHGNRGILADDGVINTHIMDNLILNIENAHCIDLRRCFSVARKKNSKMSRSNIGNRMKGNVVDGSVKFFVRWGDPGSMRGENVHLPKGYDRALWEERWRNGGVS